MPSTPRGLRPGQPRSEPRHRYARRIALWRLGVAATAYGMADGARQLALPLELPDAPELAPLGAWQSMIADYATTGLTVHDHPLALLRPGLAESGAVTSADLERLPHETPVRIGGLVIARQRPGTANGIVFILLEDELGTVNLVVSPAVYERHRLEVRTEPLLVAEGTLERFAAGGGAVSVLVHRLVALEPPTAQRPAAEVKDFSPLDERELERIAEERELAAVAAAGNPLSAVAAAGGPVSAVAAAGGPVSAVATGGGPPVAVPTPGSAPAAGVAAVPAATDAGTRDDAAARDDGADFRAVAPPVLSFTQGRRR